MKAATRNFVLVFLLLCAVGVAISFIPVAHESAPAAHSTSAAQPDH